VKLNLKSGLEFDEVIIPPSTQKTQKTGPPQLLLRPNLAMATISAISVVQAKTTIMQYIVYFGLHKQTGLSGPRPCKIRPNRRERLVQSGRKLGTVNFDFCDVT
jgi:hypothetical protein